MSPRTYEPYHLSKVPLADEVLTLLLLGSLSDSWEALVVTLVNAEPQGKHLTLEQKSSLLNEEARRKDIESSFDSKALEHVRVQKWKDRAKMEG